MFWGEISYKDQLGLPGLLYHSQIPAQQPLLFLPSQERNLMLWVAINSFLKIAIKCICEKSVSVKLSTCSLDGDR